MDECQNFEQYNFRMPDVSKLKIYKFLNIEHPMRVATIGNENWEDSIEINLYQWANMRIGEITSGAEYRIHE